MTIERVFGVYKLNDEEIAARSQSLAESLRMLEAKELEKKAAVKRFGSEIDTIKEEIYKLKNQVLDGEESGYFDYEIEKDFQKMVKRCFCNNQLVATLPLSIDEKQLSMNDSLGN